MPLATIFFTIFFEKNFLVDQQKRIKVVYQNLTNLEEILFSLYNSEDSFKSNWLMNLTSIYCFHSASK